MKWQGKILLLLLMGLYFLTRWARANIEIPDFFRFHFTDLLFVPVQMMIALWATRRIKRNPSIRVSTVWVVLQVILVSFLFEWYMPNFGERGKYTSDLIDVLMYVLGGIGFMCFQRWENQNPKRGITLFINSGNKKNPG